MAEEIVLSVKSREVVGKQVRALRRAGWIPLSVYGANVAARNMQAEERPLRAVLSKAGHNRLIRLESDEGQPQVVIAREIQREPISGKLWHVDFQTVSMTVKMDVQVPIVFQGTSPIVKSGNALLIHGLEEISIRVLPGDLISEIHVDISGLENIGDSIHVSDLKLSETIEILTSLDELLAKIIPVKEEVVASEAPVATAEVEVVSKGKKEEEGAAEE